VWPLALVTYAKVSPVLATPIRRWREMAIALGVIALCTLPWWHLWVDYVEFLRAQPLVAGTIVAVPWYWRSSSCRTEVVGLAR
jgi:hypothetical protein